MAPACIVNHPGTCISNLCFSIKHKVILLNEKPGIGKMNNRILWSICIVAIQLNLSPVLTCNHPFILWHSCQFKLIKNIIFLLLLSRDKYQPKHNSNITEPHLKSIPTCWDFMIVTYASLQGTSSILFPESVTQ